MQLSINCNMPHFEDELEVLMLQNPKGGKPRKIGSTLILNMNPHEKVVDISEVREDTSMRFHLGYCPCGSKIAAGEKRALLIIKTLCDKLGIDSFEDLQSTILSKIMNVR